MEARLSVLRRVAQLYARNVRLKAVLVGFAGQGKTSLVRCVSGGGGAGSVTAVSRVVRRAWTSVW